MILKSKFSSLSIVLTLTIVSILFLSNKGGVPQAVTKAPGETANASCNACHTGGTFSSEVNLTLMNLDSVEVNSYAPGQKHLVKIKVNGNGAKTYGFQMVSLSNAGTKDVGLWSNFGASVKQLTLINRKYLCQSAARQDGIFYAQWTAPAASEGEVKFYYSGLAANSNGNNNGDEAVWASKAILPTGVSSTDENIYNSISIFPNPTSDYLNFSSPIKGKYQIVDVSGKIVDQGTINNSLDVSRLNPNVYGLVIADQVANVKYRLTFVKQ